MALHPLHSVVVGYDGSAASWAAARYAAAEAGAADGVVRLVHAPLDLAAYAATSPLGLADDVQTAARRLVDAARDALLGEHPGLDVRAVVTDRAPGAALVRATRSADLLVLGRYGRHTAAHVIAYAACPVIVAGAAPDGTGALAVVLGADDAVPHAPALWFAFDAARRRGAVLRICHVLPPGRGADPDERRQLSEALAAWRPAFAEVPVAVDVLAGLDPAARLLDAAAEASLVVLGSRHRTVGDVASAVIANTTCPVALVREAPRRARLPAHV
ncbi:universal stress protein [Dactylosporangium sp. AC04546]|uniref:universal stress protein n=1 Tax=Dactylosporangium sp. AC04546 TaxID=2862460 RepID=UPI001EE00E3C|nr:universal stress protein [Dactylosporangium sp. AC04546]WVK78536.1 universal stress protein [Dactylosporangium sp. AC04546]